MRNLKKILALVLALVMSFSLMATANAFTDSEKITGTYEEAVEVLNALKVFQGYEDGSFQPQGSITRAEVAAIIYRIVTGDVTDTQKGIYADYNKFNDVKSTSWYAGYVNFCANAEYIKGYDAKTFGPNDPVTGYQALAMILRAVGYDVNGEFTGSDWQVQTAAVGKKLGITDNVSEGTLGTAASREVVAEILFRAILVPQVEYTVAFGYQSIGQVSIGYETFKLLNTVVDGYDKWGNPNYTWKLDKAPYNKVAEASDTTLVTIAYKPVATYNTAVKECDVAEVLGKTVAGEYAYETIVNAQAAQNTYINPIDTVNTIGGQGRQTNVYSYTSKQTGVAMTRIVMVDTFLAEVTLVVPATYDNAGHVKTYAALYLNVYDKANSLYTSIVEYSTTNYTYAKGDMLLVNVKTVNANGVNATGTVAKAVNSLSAAQIDILGAAESIIGTQTIIWQYANKHTVNGTDYPDAMAFYLDQAQKDITTHAWYMDGKGNLIGVKDVATQYTYGVISALWWYNDGTNGGVGNAYANITYMDGTKSDNVKISSINGARTAYAQSQNQVGFVGGHLDTYYVSTYATNNAGLLANDMYAIATLADGTLALTETAELTNADVYNKVSAIAGTTTTKTVDSKSTSATGDDVQLTSKSPVYADNFTQYLVRTGANGVYTFTPVTGIENIGNFANNADVKVDYVDTDGDKFVDYVYITGTADAAQAYEFVYMTSKTNAAYLYDTQNGVWYYQLLGVVHADGTTDALKVAAAQSALKDQLVAGTQKLFMVGTTNGYVTSVVEITSAGQVLTAPVTSYAEFEGTAQFYLDNGVLVVADGTRYNVNAATTLVVDEDGIGSIGDLANLQNKYVYVVANYVGGNRTTIATAVFISDFNNLTAQEKMNAAAAKVAAMSFSDITGTEITETSVETALKSAIETVIADSSITVQVDVATGDVPAANAKKTGVTVNYALYLDGATPAMSSAKTVSITHLYTEAELKDAVNALIPDEAQVGGSGYENWEAAKATITAAVKAGITDVTTGAAVDFTINADASDFIAGKVLTVNYTVTYNKVPVTSSTTITLK